MAAPRIIAALIPAPNSAGALVHFLADDEIVAATTCIPWEAVAAVGGVPAKMAAPQWALFYAFGLKFTLTRSPAELVLHRAIHALNPTAQRACVVSYLDRVPRQRFSETAYRCWGSNYGRSAGSGLTNGA